MKFIYLIIFSAFTLNAFYTQAQQVQSVKIENIEKLMNTKDDSIRVFNFWATWCKPCVAEIPFFEKANATYHSEKVHFYLIAVEDEMDKVQNFVSKKNLQTTVLYLNETDANSWIPKINGEWDGAIPVTFFIENQSGTKIFKSSELSEEELNKEINDILNKSK